MNKLIEKKINEIKFDKDLGASELAEKALVLLQFSIEQRKNLSSFELLNEIKTLCFRLRDLRPSMQVIKSRIDNVLANLEKLSNDDSISIKEIILNLISKNILESRNAKDIIKQNASSLLKEHNTVLVHSYSSTLLNIFKGLACKKIFVTESRPLCEGVKMADKLSQYGHQVTLITDMESGFFLPKCDAVWVGSDTFFLDGTLVNKMGT
ncbi:MAG: hypothetical protein OEV44_11280, partial [Spirochaetota bacterium]|nr:hypothetical protein [Spirochaetota bacterium]